MVRPQKAGKFFHPIQIETFEDRQDSQGTPLREWNAKKYVYGLVQDVKGIETVIAEKLDSKTTHLITVRWMPDVNSTMRFRYKDLVLYFVSVLNGDQRDIDLTIEAEHRLIQDNEN